MLKLSGRAVWGNLSCHLQQKILDFHLQPIRETCNECLDSNVLLDYYWEKHKHMQKNEAYQLDALCCFSWVSLSWDPSHSREVLIPSQRQQHTLKHQSTHTKHRKGKLCEGRRNPHLHESPLGVSNPGEDGMVTKTKSCRSLLPLM